jgi:hypothetical protein
MNRKILNIFGNAEAILQSCFGVGHRPSEDEIYMWNEFMRKKRLERRTLGNTGSGEKERSHPFQTMFQFIDADEGRLVNGSYLNGKNGSTRQNLMVHHIPFRFEQPDSSRSEQSSVQHV